MSIDSSVKRKILVVAPHPDDETLGCGGTLLRLKNEGHKIYWVIVTEPTPRFGGNPERVKQRNIEIENVTSAYGFEKVFRMNEPVIEIDQTPTATLVQKFSDIFTEVKPNDVFFPYRGDVHSDHKITFDAAIACTKWFRYPSVKCVYNYEVASETEFGISPESRGFRPNVYVDISAYIERKIEIMKMFPTEMAPFPFPRSETTLRALAQYRGSSSGFHAAEAFMLLVERV